MNDAKLCVCVLCAASLHQLCVEMFDDDVCPLLYPCTELLHEALLQVQPIEEDQERHEIGAEAGRPRY